jgi:hypothetical protein
MLIVEVILYLPFMTVTKMYIIFVHIRNIKKRNMSGSVYANAVSIGYALCTSLF